mmetsp:Transcript_24604/g.93011  ORF Transcript_24604/g.93011 Transcript_24604/m.93011 type:complete len:237 (-) Transcript_24604:7480-8190(-)
MMATMTTASARFSSTKATMPRARRRCVAHTTTPVDSRAGTTAPPTPASMASAPSCGGGRGVDAPSSLMRLGGHQKGALRPPIDAAASDRAVNATGSPRSIAVRQWPSVCSAPAPSSVAWTADAAPLSAPVSLGSSPVTTSPDANAHTADARRASPGVSRRLPSSPGTDSPASSAARLAPGTGGTTRAQPAAAASEPAAGAAAAALASASSSPWSRPDTNRSPREAPPARPFRRTSL